LLTVYSKEDIKNGLEQNVHLFINYVILQDKATFENTPEGKWSSGQNLDHLIKSTYALNLALMIPKFLYPRMFGKLNREPRTSEDVQKRYLEKLSLGGTASGRFIPPLITFEQRDSKVKQFRKELKSLIRHVNALTDHQLDNLLLPHPLLGKLTLREMLFFTIFHTTHHLNILKSR